MAYIYPIQLIGAVVGKKESICKPEYIIVKRKYSTTNLKYSKAACHKNTWKISDVEYWFLDVFRFYKEIQKI